MSVNKPPQCLKEVEMAAVDCRAGVCQRFDERTFKVRRDGQRNPTERRTKAQSGCVSLYFIKHFHISGNAFVSEERVDDWERCPVLAENMEREHLEVCDWRTSERPVNANTFSIAQQPDAHSCARTMPPLSSLMNMQLFVSVGVSTMSSALPGCCPLILILRASR